MLNFYVRHGLIADKTPEINSFEQTKRLEKYISFDTQKRNKAKNDFERGLYNLLNNEIYAKTMENVRDRLKLKISKNYE